MRTIKIRSSESAGYVRDVSGMNSDCTRWAEGNHMLVLGQGNDASPKRHHYVGFEFSRDENRDWERLYRAFIVFPISNIRGEVIESAYLQVCGKRSDDELDAGMWLAPYKFYPKDCDDLDNPGDDFGPTSPNFYDPIPVSGWDWRECLTNSSIAQNNWYDNRGWNGWAFNVNGRAELQRECDSTYNHEEIFGVAIVDARYDAYSVAGRLKLPPFYSNEPPHGSEGKERCFVSFRGADSRYAPTLFVTIQ